MTLDQLKTLQRALADAIDRADEYCRSGRFDPNSPADVAIRKLRRNRRLTLEELHTPTTREAQL